MSEKKHEYALGVISIGTLRAFDEYASTVSWIQIVKTCVFSMAPASVAMILIELMPSAPVEEGWAANWALWIRMLFTGIIPIDWVLHDIAFVCASRHVLRQEPSYSSA